MKNTTSFSLFVIFFLFTKLSICQNSFSNDSINKYSKDNKKNGIWIEYLDRDWNEVKPEEKNNAYFFRYVFYDNGFRVTSTLKPDKHKIKKDTLLDIPNKPIVLNGKYAFYYKNGTPFCTVEYSNGLESGKQYYFNTKGVLINEYFYDRKWENNPYTFFVKEYNNKGEVKSSGFYYKWTSGWAVYAVKE